MKLHIAAMSALACTLWGCAAPPPVASLPESQMWQDASFHYRAGLVAETPESLFAINNTMLTELSDTKHRILSQERRINDLLSLLYTDHGILLDYSSGHSTGAAQTWSSKKGDCLSLTILTYALAKAEGLDANMREVTVTPILYRHNDVDFVSQHVNVFIPTRSSVVINRREFPAGGIVVDFEPQASNHSRGVTLDENQIVARFYNNRGSEYLSARDEDTAYAYYRAAIALDPGYGAAYSNLAHLYTNRGLGRAAEVLLWHAVALDKHSDVPMRNLHILLVAQGRSQEAQQVAEMLDRFKEQDPYYWLQIGVQALQRGSLRSAISALEKADELSIGFEDVHFHLGVAYARSGQRVKAAHQLALLDAINHDAPGVELLNKKLQNMAAKSTLF